MQVLRKSQRAGITAQIATIQETAKAAARHGVTRDTIAQMEGDLGALVDESEGCTAAIEKVDAYKAQLMQAKDLILD